MFTLSADLVPSRVRVAQPSVLAWCYLTPKSSRCHSGHCLARTNSLPVHALCCPPAFQHISFQKASPRCAAIALASCYKSCWSAAPFPPFPTPSILNRESTLRGMGRVPSWSCGGDTQGLRASEPGVLRLPGPSGWSYPYVPWGRVSSLIPAGQAAAAPAADLDSLGVGIETQCLLSSGADHLQLLKHLPTQQCILRGGEQRYTCWGVWRRKFRNI